MLIKILCVFAAICAAYVIGKAVARLRLPSILGWLLAGILFGPYLANVITQDTVNALWYNVFIKFFECFAGVMIGKEIIVKKLASSGKRIVGITFIQSLGTFAVVSLVFSIAFLIMDIPFYLAFVFGSIALATAPAPALSIVNEYNRYGTDSFCDRRRFRSNRFSYSSQIKKARRVFYRHSFGTLRQRGHGNNNRYIRV